MARQYVYYKCQVTIFRTRVPGFNPLTHKLRKYRKEFVMMLGPLFFKEKAQAKGYLRQFAFANRSQGMYDWDFAIEWLGTESMTAKEDAHGPNNGHACPRCNRMTLQGGVKDLCEGCSVS